MATTRIEGSLYTRSEGRLATIEFGHPASNSLNSVLLNRLREEIRNLGENPNISVILIQSEGGHS